MLPKKASTAGSRCNAGASPATLGRALLLTLIYTRCPLPDYCPLMSRHFAELDRALRRLLAAAL